MSQSKQVADVIRARFKIVTPMFLGGALQEADGMRPPSIKGVLRFWWRALNWGRMLHNANGDVIKGLRLLHDAEARLFGLAASHVDGELRGGQGVFLLSFTANTPATNLSVNNFSARSYMLGLGLHSKQGLQRQAMEGEFTLTLRFRHDCTPNDRDSVVEALRVFGLLGALGSRSRHGWGSVALVSLEDASSEIPLSNDAYLAQVRALLPSGEALEPPFSAFSPVTRVAWTDPAGSALAIIDQVGAEMGVYRSWGRNGKVFNQYSAEQNFRDDHDNMFKAACGDDPGTVPKRLIFGMPHNYFFSSNGKKVDIQKTTRKIDRATHPDRSIRDAERPGRRSHAERGNDKSTDGRERRASPLLLHVHPVNDGYVGLLLLLRARFLPSQDQVQVCVNGGRTWNLPVTPTRRSIDEFWHPIDEFMTRRAFHHGDGQ